MVVFLLTGLSTAVPSVPQGACCRSLCLFETVPHLSISEFISHCFQPIQSTAIPCHSSLLFLPFLPSFLPAIPSAILPFLSAIRFPKVDAFMCVSIFLCLFVISEFKAAQRAVCTLSPDFSEFLSTPHSATFASLPKPTVASAGVKILWLLCGVFILSGVHFLFSLMWGGFL